MRRRIKSFLLIATLLAQLAYAEEAVLNIKSTKADFNYQTGVAIYTGDVVLSKGIVRLEAEKVISYHNKRHQLVKAIAFGSPAHLWQAATKEQTELNAYAKRIEYYPNKHLVILIGNGNIIHDNNTLTAPYITYNVQTQELSTQPSKNERTIIILHKKQ